MTHLSRPHATALIAVLALAGTLVLWGAALAKHAALNELQADGREHLTLYAAFLHSELNKLELLSAAVCSNPSVAELLAHKNDRSRRDRMNHSLEQFSQATRTAMAYVMDTQGEVVAASNWREAASYVGQSMRNRPYWQSAVRSRPARFVGFGRDRDALGLFFSCPVSAAGRGLGAVVVREDITHLIGAWRGHPTLRLMVADQHGVIFLAHQPQWLLRTLHPLSAAERRELESTGQYRDHPLRLLPVREERQWRAGITIVAIPAEIDARAGHAGDERRYLLQTDAIPTWGWTVHVLSDLGSIERRPLLGAAMAAALESVIAVLGFYFHKRRQYLRQIIESSIRDPLTGLYTRLYMTDAVPALESLQDRGQDIHIALVMFDLDHFKRVNDTHGHRCGDAVLRAIGRIILEESRESDIPVRYGGEELAAFLIVHDAGEAVRFAERICERTRERDHFEQWALRVTMSAGVAVRRPFEPLAHLIERADRKLYEAKRAGRDRVLADEETVGAAGPH